MTVVGFDISSYQLDWAWISELDGQPKHRFLELGKSGDAIIDRIRNIRGISLPLYAQEVVVEYPYSVNRQTNATLMAVIGALTARLTVDVRVAWVDARDVREAIGAKNTKDDAHRAIRELHDVPDWRPDALDALVACVGWSRILQAQDAA